MRKLLLVFSLYLIMALSDIIATTGQILGLPEWNLSEKVAGTNTQTRPSAGLGSGGLLGQAGYVYSPIPGGTQNYPVSGGVAQSGPQAGQTVSSNPPPQNPTQTNNTNNNNGGFKPYVAPVSGYGSDPNFRYSGWGQDFGTGAAGQAAYEAYRASLGLNAQGGFDQAAYDQQLNAAYDPAFRQADDVEAMYRAEYPTSQEFINQSYAEVLPQLQSEQQTRLGGLDTQARKGKSEEKNQIATARQKYNELRTGGLTRFGGASSTGEAYNELLGRTTSQEMGGITQNFGQMQQDIEKERANVNDFYASKMTSLEKEKQLKLQELKNSFDDEIRKINSTRASLESEKAGKRMAAIQEFSVQARQAQYDAQIFQQKLQAWKAAKDEAVQLATQFGAKSFSVPSMPGVMGGFSVTGQNQTTGTGSAYDTAQGITDPDQLAQYGYFIDANGQLKQIKGKVGGNEDQTYNPDTGQWE